MCARFAFDASRSCVDWPAQRFFGAGVGVGSGTGEYAIWREDWIVLIDGSMGRDGLFAFFGIAIRGCLKTDQFLVFMFFLDDVDDIFLHLVLLSPTLSSAVFSSTSSTPGARRPSFAHNSEPFPHLPLLDILRTRTSASRALRGGNLSVLWAAQHRFGEARCE